MLKPCSAFKFLIWPALFFGVVLQGCSHTTELLIKTPVEEPVHVNYTVIYYIHADSDYLYHDRAGKPVRGNSKVFDTALHVAEEAESGEVFIFYQRSEKKILGLFPRKNSRFYHFQHGELTSRVNYRHSDKSEDFLTTESGLYHQYRARSGAADQRNYFLYYGHEIPEDEGTTYHRTNPGIAVNTASLSAGMQFLLRDGRRFQLVVLSTCNNGTPVMAEKLMPYTDVLLASPQNLHLSHIDSDRLDLLESDSEASPIQVAHAMAGETSQRLEAEIETAITLSVYDFEAIQEYENELHSFAMEYVSAGSKQHFSDNIDCNLFLLFDEGLFAKGVKTWYKPARFGRRSAGTAHSGWGCKPLTEN
jgi:hypothetical protein